MTSSSSFEARMMKCTERKGDKMRTVGFPRLEGMPAVTFHPSKRRWPLTIERRCQSTNVRELVRAVIIKR